MEPPLQTSKALGKARRSPADEGSIEGPTSKGEREWGAHETQREGLSRIPTPQPHFIGSGSPRVRGPGSPLFARVGQVFGGVARRRFLFPSHAPRYHVKLACQLPSPPLFPHAHTHTHALAPHPVAACPHHTRACATRPRAARARAQGLSAGRPATAGGAVRLRCRRCRRGSSSTWWLGVSFPTPSTARLRPCARCTA